MLAARLLQVSRYYSFFIVNMVAPIILTTMLGFFVFLLGVEDMEKRLGEPSSNPKTATFPLFIGSWRLRQVTADDRWHGRVSILLLSVNG
jgi:hypothetical protein